MAAALLWGTAAIAADFHTTKEMYDFAVAVAPATAAAKIRGGESSEKVLTLGLNKDRVLVVTSMQIIGSESKARLTVSDGTVAVIVVHYEGQCDTPSGDDDLAAQIGLPTIVASSDGTKLWEIGREQNVLSIRAMKSGNTFGSWETYQRDPAKYTMYPCHAS